MGKTKIEWTKGADGSAGYTWNPLRVRSIGPFGCTKISEGCLHCYACTMNKRLFGGQDYDYHHKPTNFYLDEKVLAQPLHWRKPRTIFVCSMCDLFHENVPFELIDRIWTVFCLSDRVEGTNGAHTFLLLTKRPDRMAEYIQRVERGEGHIQRLLWPARNVWLGVTAENQERANERIPVLLQIPAAKRFVSVEPMLGPVKLADKWYDYLEGWDTEAEMDEDGDPVPVQSRFLGKLDWVICGGESGPGARPMHPDWVRSLRDQCVQANVPFFLKQMVIDGKMVKMPELDGQTWEQRP